MLEIDKEPLERYLVLLNERLTGIYFGETLLVGLTDHDNRNQPDEE